MRQRKNSERPDDECPECGSSLRGTATTIYLCDTNLEALRIVELLQRSAFVRIGGGIPRLLHLDGSYSVRADIISGRHSDERYWTGNGLALDARRVTWW